MTAVEASRAAELAVPGGSISAVLVSYNTGPVLFAAIEALRSQSALRELILVDNGNPETVVTRLRELQAAGALRLITGHGNIGFAAACNLGARAAGGEWLLLLNPDCIMPPEGLGRLLEEGQKLPETSMVSACLLDVDGREQRGSRRMLLTPWVAFVEGLQLWRIAPEHPYFRSLYLHHDELPSSTTAVPVASGAVMLMRRKTYAELGGMDEAYFLHVEDIDFCLRLRRAGGKIYFVPDVRIVHQKGSSAADPILIEWHKAKGFSRYFRTHFQKEYPRPFLWAVETLVFFRFGAVAIRQLARTLLGRGQRTGRSPPPTDTAAADRARTR